MVIEERGEAILNVKKPSRMLSGVSVVAVMTHPYPCPGNCVYCPGGPSYGSPKSYFGNEPALRRARRVNFHPYMQVRHRLKQYHLLGQNPSKIEVIVMGGTFLALPDDYKVWFISMIYEALNRYPEPDPPATVDLEHAILRNESAPYRCVGLTIETRPDYGFEKHADEMLNYGATRVEIGVQSIYDEVLETINRGHGVREVVESTRILKDSGFKIVYHIMLGLPGSDPDLDVEMVKRIFEDPDFRPDMLKIYPTEVVEGTELYDWWKNGFYEPYDDDLAVEVISEIYRYIPKYVRVMRIRRDIPAQEVAAGTRKSNLRELVEKRCLEKGIVVDEIRFREVGLNFWKNRLLPDPGNLKLTRTSYEANGGVEEFIAVEEVVNNIIVGFIRVRIPSGKAHRREVDERTAIVRELHVYGPQIPVGGKSVFWQHRGWGLKLLNEAERIALEEYDVKKMLILSGVGVREYYRRNGYHRPPDSPYMVKHLR